MSLPRSTHSFPHFRPEDEGGEFWGKKEGGVPFLFSSVSSLPLAKLERGKKKRKRKKKKKKKRKKKARFQEYVSFTCVLPIVKGRGTSRKE